MLHEVSKTEKPYYRAALLQSNQVRLRKRKLRLRSPGLGGGRKRGGCLCVESHGIVNIRNTSILHHLNNLNYLESKFYGVWKLQFTLNNGNTMILKDRIQVIPDC